MRSPGSSKEFLDKPRHILMKKGMTGRGGYTKENEKSGLF